jgi:hypothetical protein
MNRLIATVATGIVAVAFSATAAGLTFRAEAHTKPATTTTTVPVEIGTAACIELIDGVITECAD